MLTQPHVFLVAMALFQSHSTYRGLRSENGIIYINVDDASLSDPMAENVMY